MTGRIVPRRRASETRADRGGPQMWRVVAMCAATAAMALLATADRAGPGPHVPDRPHRLTAAVLTAYVNKTFGPSQRCLRVVVADDTAETAAVVAMLHGRDHQRPRRDDGRATTTTTSVARSIELDGSVAAGDGPVFCQAYVVVGSRPSVVEKCFDKFRNTNTAHRMLAIVMQNNDFIEPFIVKVSETRVCDTQN